MLENLRLSTFHTNAEITADAHSGEIWIKGMYCSDQRELFQKLMDWMDLYFDSPKEYTTVNFCMDYVPNSVVREINNLLIKIDKLIQHHRIDIFWYYPGDDEDLYEAGEDFECFTKAPFHFIEKEVIEEQKKKEMNNWDYINKANQKLANNQIDEAFDLYIDYLEDINQGWKKVFLREIQRQISDINVRVLFTGIDNVDLLLLTEAGHKCDAERNYVIYMIHFFIVIDEEDSDSEECKRVPLKREEMLTLLEEILPEEREIEVLSVALAGEGEDPFDEYNKECDTDEEVNFLLLDDFDIKTLPEDELDDVSSNFYEFVNSLSTYLQPDSIKKVLTKNKSDDFQIKDIAPVEFLNYIDELKPLFLNESTLNNIFELSLNMVLVNSNNIVGVETAKYFLKSVNDEIYEDGKIEVVQYSFNEIDSADSLRNFLEGQGRKIIVIENLEKELKAERLMNLDVTKSDLVQILCNHMERDTKNIFILSIEKSAWEKQDALYPLLRVCFQHIFHFSQYSENHLLSYFQNRLKEKEYSLNDDAKELALEYFKYLKKQLTPHQFRPMLSTMLDREVRYYNAIRDGELLEKSLKVITRSDVYDAIKDEYLLEEKRPLTQIMQDLDNLVGLDDVKQGIKDNAAFVKMTKLRKSNDEVSLNSIFSGNPGTGKTTVASILGEIYKSIGVLSKGHVVVVKRHDIVGQFIGQTAINMKNFIDQARGGILFIDEAYALYKRDSEKDYGIEAIDTLVAEMENIKDSTCVILAGYPELMLQFLDSNPGLASRFPYHINFTDYDENALVQIFLQMVDAASYVLEESAIEAMNNFITILSKEKSKHFGNARECRNLFEKLKLIHASRIIYNESESENDLNLIKYEDVNKLISSYIKVESRVERPRRIGYVQGE